MLMEQGQPLASIPFAQLERLGNERLAFVIGGADGLTDELEAQPLAIEPLTDDLSHELARLLLLDSCFMLRRSCKAACHRA